jgi:hypothetical protein
MAIKLTVVHPDALKQFSQLPTGNWWINAGADSRCDEQLESCFGPETRLIAPTEFQYAAADLRAAFIRWTDCCLEGYAAEDWIPLSYFKDIYSSPVFFHLVCLISINRALQDGRSIVAITNSRPLLQQLKRLVAINGYSFEGIGGCYFWRDVARETVRAWGHFILRPLRLHYARLVATHSLGLSVLERLKKVQVMVGTFLLEGDLDEKGVFHDRFLPGLLDYYNEMGFVAASAPNTDNIELSRLRSIYRLMAASKNPFAPLELFLSGQDILFGQWKTLKALFRVPAFSTYPFEGVDVRHLAGYWWHISVLRTLDARVRTTVPRRMKEAGVEPDLFLDWYENQPSNKAIHVGFHACGANTKVIAVRQYFPIQNMINLFSTSGEVRHAAVPRVNWVCGERTSELFAIYDTEGTYLPVPALRYARIIDENSDVVMGGSLVVFLTSSLEESLSILQCAFDELSAVFDSFSGIRVKSHQALKEDIEKLAELRWPTLRRFPVTWEHIASKVLLKDAALALTGGSSVALEAICEGVPVVICGRRIGLNTNPLEDISDENWRVVYAAREFVMMLREWFPSLSPVSDRRRIGSKIRARYFRSPTPQNMRAFLPEKPDQSTL